MPEIKRGLPRTSYRVFVKDGRIGKARQIAPFDIEVKALPHDLDRIRDEVCRHISRYAKTKGTDVIFDLRPDTHFIYADVYSNLSNQPIGLIKLEQIKE